MHLSLPKTAGPPWRPVAHAVLLLAASLSLAGCAELMLATNSVILARTLTHAAIKEDETNREALGYASAEVWSALTSTVEHDGRTLVSRDDGTLTLRVAYPFSWLHNNWGGVLTVSCEPVQEDSSGPGTVVRIVSDAKDSTSRVRRIGDAILGRVRQQLNRQHAPQPSPAASSAA
ncbi:MAG: hypothetical protein QM722_22615 [Piscinibacter sp.]